MRKFSGINVYFNLERNEIGSTEAKDLKVLEVYVGKLVPFDPATHRIFTQLFVNPFYCEPNVAVKFEENEKTTIHPSRDGETILKNVVMCFQFKLVTSKNNVQDQ